MSTSTDAIVGWGFAFDAQDAVDWDALNDFEHEHVEAIAHCKYGNDVDAEYPTPSRAKCGWFLFSNWS